jgi:hypothetical protein
VCEGNHSSRVYCTAALQMQAPGCVSAQCYTASCECERLSDLNGAFTTTQFSEPHTNLVNRKKSSCGASPIGVAAVPTVSSTTSQIPTQKETLDDTIVAGSSYQLLEAHRRKALEDQMQLYSTRVLPLNRCRCQLTASAIGIEVRRNFSTIEILDLYSQMNERGESTKTFGESTGSPNSLYRYLSGVLLPCAIEAFHWPSICWIKRWLCSVSPQCLLYSSIVLV